MANGRKGGNTPYEMIGRKNQIKKKTRRLRRGFRKGITERKRINIL